MREPEHPVPEAAGPVAVVGDDPSAGRDVGVMGEAALDRVRRCLDPAKNPGQRIIPDPRVFQTVHGTHAGSHVRYSLE